jgi:hypothetical protein
MDIEERDWHVRSGPILLQKGRGPQQRIERAFAVNKHITIEATRSVLRVGDSVQCEALGTLVSGQRLKASCCHEVSADEPRHPASLTKIEPTQKLLPDNWIEITSGRPGTIRSRDILRTEGIAMGLGSFTDLVMARPRRPAGAP